MSMIEHWDYYIVEGDEQLKKIRAEREKLTQSSRAAYLQRWSEGAFDWGIGQ